MEVFIYVASEILLYLSDYFDSTEAYSQFLRINELLDLWLVKVVSIYTLQGIHFINVEVSQVNFLDNSSVLSS